MSFKIKPEIQKKTNPTAMSLSDKKKWEGNEGGLEKEHDLAKTLVSESSKKKANPRMS